MKTISSQTTLKMNKITLTQPLEQCLFFDIETTGLSPRASSLYLIGTMAYDTTKGIWEMTQWFADKHRDEENIIRLFLDTLEQYDYLYHFNGKTFDIPYLLHKANKYHIELSDHDCQILQDTTGTRSIDLLSQIRPLKKILGISKAGQTDLERFMGINREDTYSGGDLIPVYSQYMQDRILHPEQAGELERILLLHNHDDMEGMLSVSQMLHYRYLFDMIPALENQLQITEIALHPSDHEQASSLHLQFRHHAALPVTASLTEVFPLTKDPAPAFTIPPDNLELTEDSGILRVPLISTELKYFLPNPKEYYYLPLEDQAIHKSVAEFVDPSHRKKATAATCYLRRAGIFLPALQPYKAGSDSFPQNIPVFLPVYRDKLGFYELPADLRSENPFWKEYLIQTLRAW